MRMSNETYDFLKWIALIVVPAACTLITALGEVWNIGIAPAIAGTVGAVGTFLGACLMVSSSNYTPVKYDDDADFVRDDIEVRDDE